LIKHTTDNGAPASVKIALYPFTQELVDSDEASGQLLLARVSCFEFIHSSGLTQFVE